MDKPTVLLVEDNEATATLMTALLQRDFLIDVAADGREALEKLRTKHYAAVLLDLRMPHLDGYGVLDFLKANNPAVLPHVLIVTAAVMREDMERANEYGVCAVIGKPFDVEHLLSAVKHCAGTETVRPYGRIFSSSMILLLADMLRH